MNDGVKRSDLAQALKILGDAIARLPAARVNAIEEGLRGLVFEGGAHYRQRALEAVFTCGDEAEYQKPPINAFYGFTATEIEAAVARSGSGQLRAEAG